MNVQLRDMNAGELAAFRQYSVTDYARDLMQSSTMEEAAALAQAQQEFDELLPGSFPKRIECAGQAVGVLWYLTEETDGVHHVFVNDLIIAPAHRRKGCARAALTALAQEARLHDCTEIRLYVSDGNDAAKALYERCGYRLLRPAEAGAYLVRDVR